MILLIYVDDILITDDISSTPTQLMKFLNSNFSLKYFCPLHYFLGVEMTYNAQGAIFIAHKENKSRLFPTKRKWMETNQLSKDLLYKQFHEKFKINHQRIPKGFHIATKLVLLALNGPF